jgi:hypothetical protein
VSGTTVRPSAEGSRSDAGGAGQEGRSWWLSPVGLVIGVLTVLALGLRVYYQWTRPGFLLAVTEYDDGPYFGSAVRLVHGVLPYRDFIFVQPPGITLLMVPAALAAKVTGTAWGLAAGRVLTVLAGTASVVLGGLLVRHRGLVAVLVTCGVLAVYPDAVAAAHTVLVEPWLVLFCLIGAVAVFDGDRLAGGRRLAWGGVAFGFAGAVEPWAIVPVLVVAALCLPGVRRAAVFIAGVAAGFLLPVIPFLAAAPRQFYQSLITAQIGPRAGATREPLTFRLQNMTGLVNVHGVGHATVLLATEALVVCVAAAVIFGSLLTRHLPPALDWFGLVTAALVAVMFLWPSQFHYHFAAFFAPFLALSIALPVSRLVAGVGAVAGGPGDGRWLDRAVSGVVALAIVVFAVVQARGESSATLVIGRVPAAAARMIPPGACVLTDQVSLTIVANRFTSDVPGCSQMVDGLGTDLALSHGLKPSTGAGRVPAVAAVWRSAFDHAQYVWLSWGSVRRVPWNPSLTAYFHGNFVRVLRDGTHDSLYIRKGLHPR